MILVPLTLHWIFTKKREQKKNTDQTNHNTKKNHCKKIYVIKLDDAKAIGHLAVQCRIL